MVGRGVPTAVPQMGLRPEGDSFSVSRVYRLFRRALRPTFFIMERWRSWSFFVALRRSWGLTCDTFFTPFNTNAYYLPHY